MKPKSSSSGQLDLFRAQFDQILNPQHPLIILAGKIDWGRFERAFDDCYSPDMGAPAKAIRLMVGLHYLKHTFNESDESGRNTVVHHSISGKFAIRDGRWKLVLCPGSGGWTLDDAQAARDGLPLVQLYDMQADPGETRNLHVEHPDRVKALLALLKQYVADGRSTPGSRQENDVPVDIWKLDTMPDVKPAVLDDY